MGKGKGKGKQGGLFVLRRKWEKRDGNETKRRKEKEASINQSEWSLRLTESPFGLARVPVAPAGVEFSIARCPYGEADASRFRDGALK